MLYSVAPVSCPGSVSTDCQLRGKGCTHMKNSLCLNILPSSTETAQRQDRGPAKEVLCLGRPVVLCAQSDIQPYLSSFCHRSWGFHIWVSDLAALKLSLVKARCTFPQAPFLDVDTLSLTYKKETVHPSCLHNTAEQCYLPGPRMLSVPCSALGLQFSSLGWAGIWGLS